MNSQDVQLPELMGVKGPEDVLLGNSRGKLAGEALCSAYYHSFGLRAVSLRFANVYGPYSDHKTSVIIKFTTQIGEGKPLIIYGDGTQTRDFIHVDDICQAIYLSLTIPDSGQANDDCWGGAFQVGTGVETSVNYLVELLRELMANAKSRVLPSELKVAYEPERRGEIKRNYSDITKAASRLGFKPEVELRKGLEDLWR